MKMMNHGGNCCGITHIYLGGNVTGPETPVYALPALTPIELSNAESLRLRGVYTIAAPAETLGERLKRLIRFKEATRSSGIIEIVLPGPTRYGDYDQNGAWGPFIRELGFKEVAAWKNSNSGRLLHVYYRLSGSPDCPPLPAEVVANPDPFA